MTTSSFNSDYLLELTPEQILLEAGRFFALEFGTESEKFSKALAFIAAMDIGIGTVLRNHLIEVIQSSVVDDEVALKLIDTFLSNNPPPTDQEAWNLMADATNLSESDSRLAALYLLQQPDLRHLFAEILMALMPDVRTYLVTELRKAPVGTPSITIDMGSLSQKTVYEDSQQNDTSEGDQSDQSDQSDHQDFPATEPLQLQGEEDSISDRLEE